ncbi:hypothetical protein SAMN03159341_1477 [Paenibacillus sp. 1_12]|uniref:hypothetical protein n=1 Tax=Paenibacillus sp. 1_12 TaxID=1566278 RepID=UPI0008DF9A43|nr:hypothetical protein [Paenibacillus sp. 1_12]SFM54626.1 hypothetical protein SAMN03159341_1477 [Paenibacillus sp. 1_12]
MKQFSPDKVPADMFTKARLKKMGLFPISEHSAYITYPPSKRRYKLYKLDNARPIDNTVGYSLLIEASNSSEEIISTKEKLREISKRLKPI